jgi:hypothetical protein
MPGGSSHQILGLFLENSHNRADFSFGPRVAIFVREPRKETSDDLGALQSRS